MSEKTPPPENDGQITIQRPQLFKAGGDNELRGIIETLGPVQVIDRYRIWLEELYALDHPGVNIASEEATAYINANNLPENGTWVHYPWANKMTHILDHSERYRLFTSRNNPIIDPEEQQLLKDCRVGIAGLSVGRSGAMLMSMVGVENFRLSDSDEVGPSNLNRLLGSGILEIGEEKPSALSKRMFELNPYMSIDAYSGLSDKNMPDFLLGKNSPLKVVVDAMDDLAMKVKLRQEAKKHGITVMMATDLDWEPILEVESPNSPIFHGKLTEEDMADLLAGKLSFPEKTRLAGKIIGNNIPPRVMKAMHMAMKGEIGYWPQIAPGATASAILLTRGLVEVLKNPQFDTENAVFRLSELFK